mmetsp:Transcript_38499/g.46492  ORF Transcript_38499/g.46492 Transcript_38499/m.46492 type:complete len:112 (+) Transcript_38499:269-604(+)|eukprot:CAMPEP_0197853512 /NCGR_PEP_ID=MMETSP1438-20131217/22873_1 /TAXON_ID=1461541 /ORGANISM="Pterosperma sp., Strain CCMP1384" /LENGTH=111 /DNA_ID=CAMNT_0043467947 /DNA_START=241 /DNA_END=576 /DNA_ORIENTATION=-
MKIFIKDEASFRPRSLFGGHLPLEVEPTDNIAVIKKKILEMGGVEVENQRLVLNGDLSKDPAVAPFDELRFTQFRWKQLLDAPLKRLELEDNRALQEYGIGEDTTLLLIDQ